MKVICYFLLFISFISLLLGCEPVYAVKYSVDIEQEKPKKTKKYYNQREKLLFLVINDIAIDNHLVEPKLSKLEKSTNPNLIKVYYTVGFELVVRCIEAKKANNKYEIELWDLRSSSQSKMSQKIETELLNAITEKFGEKSIKIKCIIAKSYFY